MEKTPGSTIPRPADRSCAPCTGRWPATRRSPAARSPRRSRPARNGARSGPCAPGAGSRPISAPGSAGRKRIAPGAFWGRSAPLSAAPPRMHGSPRTRGAPPGRLCARGWGESRSGGRYGVSRGGEFCLGIDPDAGSGPAGFAGLGLDLTFCAAESARHLRLDLDDKGDLKDVVLEVPKGVPHSAALGAPVRAVARKIFEMAVSCKALGLDPGMTVGLRIRLRTPSGDAPLKEIVTRVPPFARDPLDTAA